MTQEIGDASSRGLVGKRIVIVSEHSETQYSGGRYHSWIMAEAIAAAGADVVVWTNAKPLLMRDFADYPAHDRIQLHLDPTFQRRPSQRFDLVVLTPDLRPDWSPFAAAVRTARADKARLIFLDFEAPNWFNKFSPRKRPWYRVAAWRASAEFADMVLSSTETGMAWAQTYYRPKHGHQSFAVCAPAINSIAADQTVADRERQVICISRKDPLTGHKGLTDIAGLFDQLRGFRLFIIGKVDVATMATLTASARESDVDICFESGLTDLEKFTEIRRSRLMIFLSHFEGFGYPPVEALYCGTPCVAYPLPVLRETSGEALTYAQPGDRASLREAITKALSAPASGVEHPAVATKVAFSAYVARLTALLQELSNAPPPSARERRLELLSYIPFLVLSTLWTSLYRVATKIYLVPRRASHASQTPAPDERRTAKTTA